MSSVSDVAEAQDVPEAQAAGAALKVRMARRPACLLVAFSVRGRLALRARPCGLGYPPQAVSHCVRRLSLNKRAADTHPHAVSRGAFAVETERTTAAAITVAARSLPPPLC